MTQKLIIPGQLPGWNQLNKGHWAARHKAKKDAMDMIVVYAKHVSKIKKVDGFCEIAITCFEPNRKRDHDNVQAGAAKIILDALQQAKIIKGDGQKYIKYIAKEVQVDRKNPRIEVEINERR